MEIETKKRLLELELYSLTLFMTQVRLEIRNVGGKKMTCPVLKNS